MVTLARKFYTSDFDIASAICNLIKGAEQYRHTTVQIIIEFKTLYPEKVFKDLPPCFQYYRFYTVDGNSKQIELCGLSCFYRFINIGFETLKESVKLDISNLYVWLENEGWIAVLRLAGFFLD